MVHLLENWIVLEYLPNGDLKNFLTVSHHNILIVDANILLLYLLQKNDRSTQALVKYMKDIAMGMRYLCEKGLIHRVS